MLGVPACVAGSGTPVPAIPRSVAWSAPSDRGSIAAPFFHPRNKTPSPKPLRFAAVELVTGPAPFTKKAKGIWPLECEMVKSVRLWAAGVLPP